MRVYTSVRKTIVNFSNFENKLVKGSDDIFDHESQIEHASLVSKYRQFL